MLIFDLLFFLSINNRFSRSSLTAGFQDGSHDVQGATHVQDSIGMQDLVATQNKLKEGKTLAKETFAEEKEFDDLLYTLEQHTFEGGLENVSVQSLDLNTTSPDYQKKRMSIADTHL